jgi:stage II sporulation protein D
LKRNSIYLLVVILFLSLFLPNSQTEASTNLITVKLVTLGKNAEFPITFRGQYFLEGDTNFTLDEGQNYKVKLVSNQLILYKNDSEIKRFTSSFSIHPKEYGEANFITIGTKRYLGTIKFEIEDNKYIRPINTLPLEDYLKGVVPNEMFASWELNALKAQAVAARTYALGKINSVIDDTVLYQSYGGYYWNTSAYQNTNRAVNETAGEVLRYNGKLISAVYSSSNGGYTESNANYWGTTAVPYLIAQKDDFDPKSSWSFSLEKQLIDTGNLDLVNPNNWWTSVKESTNSPNTINNIKNYIKTKHFPNTDIKLVGLPSISFSGKTTGQQATGGKLVVDFYVKNADGSYQRESGTQLSENYSRELSGPSRYETSVAIADYGWKAGSEVVVLGRGDIPTDALAGAVLAKKYNSPLLLTQSKQLPVEVLEKIKALNPTTKQVFILGGTAAISDNVVQQLKNNGYNPVRIFGDSRYQTSVEIANKITTATEAIITSGKSTSPDALSIASYAAKNQIPILLSDVNKLSVDVKNYLKSKGITKVYIIGGDGAISENVIEEVKAIGINNVERIFGTDRYATSVEIAKRFSFDTNNVFFANGTIFVDALPGAVLASMMDAPLLLTKQSEFSTEPEAWLKSLGIRPMIHYLGGESAISLTTRTEVKRVLLGDIKKHQASIEGLSTLRSLVGGTVFKSYHINGVADQNGVLTVSGQGFGHGVGMSQYGAQSRAKAGQTYREILGFYYPGTVLGP